jgi:hypothetical protein
MYSILSLRTNFYHIVYLLAKIFHYHISFLFIFLLINTKTAKSFYKFTFIPQIYQTFLFLLILPFLSNRQIHFLLNFIQILRNYLNFPFLLFYLFN